MVSATQHSISHVIEQDAQSGEEYTRDAVFWKAYTSKYLFLISGYFFQTLLSLSFVFSHLSLGLLNAFPVYLTPSSLPIPQRELISEKAFFPSLPRSRRMLQDTYVNNLAFLVETQLVCLGFPELLLLTPIHWQLFPLKQQKLFQAIFLKKSI